MSQVINTMEQNPSRLTRKPYNLFMKRLFRAGVVLSASRITKEWTTIQDNKGDKLKQSIPGLEEMMCVLTEATKHREY